MPNYALIRPPYPVSSAQYLRISFILPSPTVAQNSKNFFKSLLPQIVPFLLYSRVYSQRAFCPKEFFDETIHRDPLCFGLRLTASELQYVLAVA